MMRNHGRCWVLAKEPALHAKESGDNEENQNQNLNVEAARKLSEQVA